MFASRIARIVPVILLSACAHHTPLATVEVIDTSMSITPRAEHAAENAITDQISRLGRGDRLILIPITSDAENDTGGRILRLVAPTEREAYDNDLRRFQVDAKKQYAAWIASFDPHEMQTDILGTLDVARQEFAAIPRDADRHLIILSDFLEDDPSYRFVYTVASWLLPRAEDSKLIEIFQPVASVPNEVWTDNLSVCLDWYQSGERRTVLTELLHNPKPRKRRAT